MIAKLSAKPGNTGRKRTARALASLLAFLLISGLFLVPSCRKTPSDDTPKTLRLDTVDLDGNTFSRNSITGQSLIMVNVWATWCPPCIDELPELAKVADSMASKDVYLLGVLLDGISEDYSPNQEAINHAKQLLEEAGAAYPVVLPDESFMNDFVTEMEYIPTTYFFDSRGEMIHMSIGSNDQTGWETIIDGILNK